MRSLSQIVHLVKIIRWKSELGDDQVEYTQYMLPLSCSYIVCCFYEREKANRDLARKMPLHARQLPRKS